MSFRAHLIEEALNCFLAGDIDTGKDLLRDYLNATESTHIIADRRDTCPHTYWSFSHE
jgi:hypothetical protein